MPKPIASWNPTRDCWETSQGDLLSGLSDVFSETWPRSGSMRSGTAYERPTSEPLTDGSASSLLPTPDAYEASRGGSQHPDKRREGGHSPYLASVVEWTLAER